MAFVSPYITLCGRKTWPQNFAGIEMYCIADRSEAHSPWRVCTFGHCMAAVRLCGREHLTVRPNATEWNRVGAMHTREKRKTQSNNPKLQTYLCTKEFLSISQLDRCLFWLVLLFVHRCRLPPTPQSLGAVCANREAGRRLFCVPISERVCVTSVCH